MNPHAKPGEQRPQASAVARILVVDDDTCIFDVFPQLLPPPRSSITTAADGSLALQLAAQRTFDVAFVDYYLGNMNGAEVSQKLREIQPNIEVVLMSGYLVDERSGIMERAGAHAFLLKPFSSDVAQALVERLLAGKEPGATTSLSNEKLPRAEVP